MTDLIGTQPTIPTVGDIGQAAARFANDKPMSPLLAASDRLNRLLGFDLYLKAECCTEGGSFKLHGATNFALQLDPTIRQRGLVAYSSGNHAIGVAVAAHKLDCPATVFVPTDLPEIKRHKIKLYGAKIVTFNRHTDNRAMLAEAYATERAIVLVPPFDHPWTISGQGVIGLEILCQAAKHQFNPDYVVTPCGGGGLAAGLALALQSGMNAAGLVLCEPTNYHDAQKLLMNGIRRTNPSDAVTACDALQSPALGRIPQAVLQSFQRSGRSLRALSVQDDFVRCAMALAWQEFSLALEPSGAIALATAIKFRARFQGKKMVVIASGGNTNENVFRRSLEWGKTNMTRILKLD
jgi:threonine dehydratase